MHMQAAKSLVAQLASSGVSNKDIHGPNPPRPQLSNYQKLHMQAYVIHPS